MRSVVFSFFLITHLLGSAQSPEDYVQKCEQSYSLNMDSALYYAEQAYQHPEIDHKTKGRALFLIGTCHFNLGNYDSTKLYFSKFFETDSTRLWTPLYPRSLAWLCHINIQEDNWHQALNYALTGEKLAYALKDTTRMINFHHYLGEIYRNFNTTDATQSLKHQFKALELAKDREYAFETMYTYNYLGAIYQGLDSFELAKYYYHKTVEIAVEIQDYFALGQAYHNLSTLENTRDSTEKGLNYNLTATQYLRHEADQVSYTDILAECFTEIAEYYLNRGNLNLAETYVDSAQSVVKESQNYQANIFRVKGLVEAKKGNYKNAFDLIQSYMSIDDSLSELNNIKHINNLLQWYQHEKNEKLIAQLEAKNAGISLENSLLTLTNERANYQKSLLIWISIFSVIVTLGFLLWYSQKRKTQRVKNRLNEALIAQKTLESNQLQTELNFRNKSLSTYSLFLSQKNELLDSLKAQLKNMNTKVALELVNKIKFSQSFENEWIEFNSLFTEVHPNFLTTLKKQSEDLTPHDTRICVLLKMEMNSKQIAHFIGVEARSVDMARTRIRKKLGLDKSKKLSEYILEI